MTTLATDHIPPVIQKQLPEAVLRKVREMDEVMKPDFTAEFRKRRKSLGLAFVLWMAGFHRAYLDRSG